MDLQQKYVFAFTYYCLIYQTSLLYCFGWLQSPFQCQHTSPIRPYQGRMFSLNCQLINMVSITESAENCSRLLCLFPLTSFCTIIIGFSHIILDVAKAKSRLLLLFRRLKPTVMITLYACAICAVKEIRLIVSLHYLPYFSTSIPHIYNTTSLFTNNI